MRNLSEVNQHGIAFVECSKKISPLPAQSITPTSTSPEFVAMLLTKGKGTFPKFSSEDYKTIQCVGVKRELDERISLAVVFIVMGT